MTTPEITPARPPYLRSSISETVYTFRRAMRAEKKTERASRPRPMVKTIHAPDNPYW